jgi:hypothetical protein
MYHADRDKGKCDLRRKATGFDEEANRLGCVVAINGTRNHPHELGAGTFEAFSEVHSMG